MKKRVTIPGSPDKIISLVTNVRTKHQADGANSPLNLLDWQQVNPIIDRYIQRHEEAAALRRQMAIAYEQRNLARNLVITHLRKTRDVLAGVHAEEMKLLGEWGFDVFDQGKTAPTEDVPASGASQTPR